MPVGAVGFFSSPKRSGDRGSFPGVNRPGREVNVSFPNAEVKNECRCTSAPLLRLNGENMQYVT